MTLEEVQRITWEQLMWLAAETKRYRLNYEMPLAYNAKPDTVFEYLGLGKKGGRKGQTRSITEKQYENKAVEMQERKKKNVVGEGTIAGLMELKRFMGG